MPFSKRDSVFIEFLDGLALSALETRGLRTFFVARNSRAELSEEEVSAAETSARGNPLP